MPRTCSSPRRAGRVISTSGWRPRPGLTTNRRRPSTLRPSGSAKAARRRRALRRPASRRFGARTCPAVGFAIGVDRSSRRWPGRRGEPLRRDHRVPTARAVRRDLDAPGAHRVDAGEVRTNDRGCFRGRRHRDDAPVRRADLRRGRRRRPRHHRQGRAHGASAAARSSSCSTCATAACRMVVASRRPADPTRRPRRCGASASMRVATKYPRIAARLVRGHRPSGGDRRGQGLGRARAD
jgi:hypothetical protein